MGALTNLTIPAASGQLITGRGVVLWINLAETSAAAAAKVELWDGVNAGGQLMGLFQIPSATSKEIALGTRALPYYGGIWYDLISGSVAGNIAVRPAESDAEWAELLSSLAAG